MKIFGIIGQSIEVIDERKSPKCPDGHIEMKDRRPTSEHIATENGTWGIDYLNQFNERKNDIEEWINSVLKEKDYSVSTIASYFFSDSSQYQSEAKAASIWIGSVWEAAYKILNEGLENENIPPADEIITQLPKMEWPELPDSGLINGENNNV